MPSSWRYDERIDNTLGSVNKPNYNGNPDGPVLVIKGDNNIGSVRIELV